ncbi:hypothetical protein V8E53_006058 [Lactarius tabidus]
MFPPFLDIPTTFPPFLDIPTTLPPFLDFFSLRFLTFVSLPPKSQLHKQHRWSEQSVVPGVAVERQPIGRTDAVFGFTTEDEIAMDLD